MNSKGKEIVEAIEREVAEWPGAEVSIVEPKRGHPKAKLKHDGKYMSVVFGGTPSDARAIVNVLSEVRRTLRKLGAERPKPDPTPEEDAAPYRPKNDGAAKRQNPIKTEKAPPKPDVADQLVEAGAATPEQAQTAAKEKGAGMATAQAVGSTVTYALRAKVEKARDAARTVADQGDEESPEDKQRAEFATRVAAIVDGVYFGLPADVYHAVPRASSSFLQKVDISPATAWRKSWMDPERPDFDEEETSWQVLGRAYHTARLEPHLFEDLYVRELEKAEMPKGTLFTGTDMDPVLEEWGLKKSGTVAEKAERLADAGFPSNKLWHIAMADWEADRGTRTPLAAKNYDQMILDRDRISRNSQIAPLLSGGEAEVSIFWTDEHGVQMKARVDYLTRDWWADFKTFDNSRGKQIRQALTDAMRYNRYYMQAVVYREAIEAIRVGGLDVIEAQTEDQRNLVTHLRMKPGELTCWYIFQEKGGIPNLLAYEFPFYMVPMQNLFEAKALAGNDEDRLQRSKDAFTKATQLFMKGHHDVLEAKKAFVLYSQVYSEGEPWYPIDAIGRFDDELFHPYWLGGEML